MTEEAQQYNGRGFGRGSGYRGIRNEVGEHGVYRNCTLTITLSPEESRIIRETVKREGIGISEIGRKLFADWVESRKKKDAELKLFECWMESEKYAEFKKWEEGLKEKAKRDAKEKEA